MKQNHGSWAYPTKPRRRFDWFGALRYVAAAIVLAIIANAGFKTYQEVVHMCSQLVGGC